MAFFRSAYHHLLEADGSNPKRQRGRIVTQPSLTLGVTISPALSGLRPVLLSIMYLGTIVGLGETG